MPVSWSLLCASCILLWKKKLSSLLFSFASFFHVFFPFLSFFVCIFFSYASSLDLPGWTLTNPDRPGLSAPVSSLQFIIKSCASPSNNLISLSYLMPVFSANLFRLFSMPPIEEVHDKVFYRFSKNLPSYCQIFWCHPTKQFMRRDICIEILWTCEEQIKSSFA